MLGEGPEKGENSQRLQPTSPVAEWLLMCGEHSWLSWPLWGKVKIVVFLRQSQFLKDYLFIMLSIYNSFRKLFQMVSYTWTSLDTLCCTDTQTPMCAYVWVFTGMHLDTWSEWFRGISVIWSTSYYCTSQTVFWSILIPRRVENLRGLNIVLHKVK